MNNEYDLVVTLPEQFRGIPNISIHEHYHGSCYLLFSSIHPLAKNSIEHLSIVDFKDDIFYIISEDENSFIRQSCEAYCKSKGFIPNIQPLSDLNTILLSVRQQGYTIVDEWIWAKDIPFFKYIPIDLSFSVADVWKTNNTNKALQLFLETCVPDKENFKR
jgi:hypothetical protein